MSIDSEPTPILALGGPAGFYKFERGLKQREIFLVAGSVRAIDLYPFPCACDATGRKGHNVISRELQFRRPGSRQAQSDTIATDASEHLVADKIGVKPVYFSRTGTRELEQQGVDLRLAAGFGGVGLQRYPPWLG